MRRIYRFGASRAYEIVEERLAALSEEAVSGYFTWADFLQRRIAPAMRTCQSVKERQTKLSDKLTRAIALLRSWIDVELERQNRDLLASMNNRAKMQLRLQQTVEGLSVAAISYYVVSLLGYLLKGIPMVHDSVAPVMAVLVPAVMLTIWWIVRRIRHAHGDTAAEEIFLKSCRPGARELRRSFEHRRTPWNASNITPALMVGRTFISMNPRRSVAR